MKEYLSGRLMMDLEGSSLSHDEKNILLNTHVGGVILFSRNIISQKQVRSLCDEIRLVNPRLLIAVDQEGGRIQRLRKGFTNLPSMQKLALFIEKSKKNDMTFAADVGWLMASEVLASGLDISFAPVLDLDWNKSSIIGDRSFGRKPEKVIQVANSFIIGMNEAGMTGIGKHFPGHGGIHSDSHLVYSEDNRVFEDIKKFDLLPFKALHEKLGGIMTAHIAYSSVDKEIATFSKFWLGDILRDDIGFEGVIFSDDLSMKGTDYAGDIIEKIQKSLSAGCDMILICNDRSAVYQALEFMESRRISQSPKISSLKATHSISWAELKKNTRRENIIKNLSLLNNEYL
jgi:beta-N-acetylhexosaminidase